MHTFIELYLFQIILSEIATCRQLLTDMVFLAFKRIFSFLSPPLRAHKSLW